MINRTCEKKRVVLWDIDGTLSSPIRNNTESPHVNAIVKNGFNPTRKSPRLVGSTDFEVISSLMDFYPSKENNDALEKCFRELDNLSLSLYDSKSFLLCQGLPQVLVKINELGWDNGILTGNTNLRMNRKLEILKIADFFNKDLMFSCNFKDARENITIRAKKILNSSGFLISFIVGDTPRDIVIAKKYGLKVVAVSTGIFSYKKLKSFAPDLLIRNLEDDLEIFLDFAKCLNSKI